MAFAAVSQLARYSMITDAGRILADIRILRKFTWPAAILEILLAGWMTASLAWLLG